MRLKDADSPPAGYFTRPSSEEPERGPFTIENLRDLAEFQHVRPESLIRTADSEIARPIREIPELFAAIFPKKAALHFKTSRTTYETDAGHAAVDVADLFRCKAAPPPPLPATTGERPSARISLTQKTPALPEETAFDTREILAASVAISRERRGGSKERRPPRPGFSAGRMFLVVRWGLALLLVGLSMWIWSDVGKTISVMLTFLIGMVPMVGAILLVAGDVISWTMDAFTDWRENQCSQPPDYSAAEERYRAEEWAAAATEFLKLLETHPRELRAYMAGIGAAAAANDSAKITAFHALALEKLGEHDRNLLANALYRRGLPPLPQVTRQK